MGKGFVSPKITSAESLRFALHYYSFVSEWGHAGCPLGKEWNPQPSLSYTLMIHYAISWVCLLERAPHRREGLERMRWRGRKSEWTSLFVMHISSISLGMGPNQHSIVCKNGALRYSRLCHPAINCKDYREEEGKTFALALLRLPEARNSKSALKNVCASSERSM